MGFLSLMDAKWDLNKYKQLWLLSVLRTAKRVARLGQGASKSLAVGDRARLPLGRQGCKVPAVLPGGAEMGPPSVPGCCSRHSWAVNCRSRHHPSPAHPGKPPRRAAGIVAGLSALLQGASRTVQSWGSLSSPPSPYPTPDMPLPSDTPGSRPQREAGMATRWHLARG